MKISIKKKSKGKTSAKIFSTDCQDYSPDMKEYVFAIKGRPFAMLSSQKLPVPPVSLIDFNLVRDLGLEIQDLQCSKYTFAGVKLRILGRVSQTLQTIQHGAISGTAHVRANVVENLYQTFDTRSIAGQQMLTALQPSPARSEDPPPSVVDSSPSDVSRTESPPRHRSQPHRERQVPQVQPPPDPPGQVQPSPESRGDASGAKPTPLNVVPTDAGEATQKLVPYVNHLLAREPVPSFYGRIVQTDPLEVDYEVNGEIYTEIYTSNIPSSYRKLEVGDAVLCRQYPGWDAARRDGHTRPFAISRLYTEMEAYELTTQGAVFPDVPPDLHPHGYYG